MRPANIFRWEGTVLELLQLKYFRALAHNEHLLQTARELSITPSTISMSISRLESELDVKLFDRVGRNIRLNDYGRLFLPYADQIFQSLEGARQALGAMKGQKSGVVSFSVKDGAFYNSIIRRFHEQNPDIVIRQIEGDPGEKDDPLYVQDLDFILTPVDLRDRADLAHQFMYEDLFVLAVPASHPLADRETVSLRELENESFIGRSTSTYIRGFVDALCKKHGFTPNYIMECDYMLKTEMLSQGMGIAFTTLYSSMLSDYFYNIRVLKIEELADERYTFHLYWNKKRALSPAALHFRAYLQEYFAHVHGLYADW